MSKDAWKTLYGTLEVRKCTKGYRRATVKKAAVKSFERQHSFRFPDSYMEFLEVFGPGFVGGYFNIAAPGYGLEGQIAHRNKSLRALQDVFGEAELLPRMIIFSDTLAGDLVAWDPEDISNSTTHEYGIYVLPRSGYEIAKLADTFAEFINSVCLGTGFDAISGDWGEQGTPQKFEPRVEKVTS